MTTMERRVWLGRTLLHAGVLAGIIFAAYIFLVAAPIKGSLAFDVVSYWSLDLARPYHGAVGDLGFFPYSPAVALLLAPFSALPWPAFVTLWYAVLLGALAWLGRRSALVLLAFPPVAIDLYHGNIHLLLAAAIVLGFRYPAAWSVVVLAKVTPGIGLLWFLARREWLSFAVAVSATVAIVSVTAVLLPTQWADWLAMLVANSGTPPPWPALPVPIWLRLPAAAAIVWWGAKRDARWTVPLAAALSVPALWPGAFAILAACWPLSRRAHATAPAGVPATAPAAVPATAPAAQQEPDYHAPDARQRRGEREPATA